VKFVQEKENAQDARKDYYFTKVSALLVALMASLLLKANVLLARTRTVLNAVKTLTTAKFVKPRQLYSILDVFLLALKELTYKREDAENVIQNARNAQLTKLVLDARLNSTLLTQNVELLALTEKYLLKVNVSPALIPTARTA
jgi:hypothetical protein